MPPTSAEPPAGSSRRARMRLLAVVLLGVLAALHLVLAVRLYFFTTFDPVARGLLAVVLAAIAVVYVLLTRAVARQSRPGHLLAIVVCVLAAVLGLAADMHWLDWTVLAVNVATLVLLAGSLPRRRPAPRHR